MSYDRREEYAVIYEGEPIFVGIVISQEKILSPQKAFYYSRLRASSQSDLISLIESDANRDKIFKKIPLYTCDALGNMRSVDSKYRREKLISSFISYAEEAFKGYR